MSFARKSLLTFLARAGAFIFGFISQVWIARLLGPEGKGAYAVLTLIPALVAQVASLGLHNAYIYFIGKKKIALKPAAENTLVYSLIAGGALLGIYWLSRQWLDPALFKGISPAITAWVSLAFPLHLIFLIFNYLALAQNDFIGFNLPHLGRSAYILLGLLLVTPLLKIDLWTVNMIWVVTNVVLAAQSWWLIFRRERFSLRWHPALFRTSLKFGLQSHIGTIFYLLGWRLDFLLCNLYLDTRAVGYYSTATLIGEMLWFIPQTFAVVLLPEVSRMNSDQAVRLTSQVSRLTLLSSAVGAVFLVMIASFLIRTIFGEEFIPAVSALWLLLPGMIFESCTRLLSSFFVGRGHPLASTYSAALVCSSNLLINLWWIPRYSIRGAALASTLSYGIGMIYLLRSFQRTTNVSYTNLLLVQREDLQAITQIYHRFRGLND